MARLIDEGPHALSKYNMVPVERLVIPEELYLGNRVYLSAKAHCKRENELEWALTVACLAMLVIYTDKDMAGPVTLSEVGSLVLNPGDKAGYLEPTGTTFELQAKRISSLREEIYRACYLMAQGRDSTATASALSGTSKEIDLRPAMEALEGFGDILRSSIERVINMVVRARGDELVASVRGFNFAPDISMDEVVVAEGVLGMDIPSETLRRAMQKRIAARAMRDEDPETVRQAMAEIDAAPTPDEKEAQRQAARLELFAASAERRTATTEERTGAEATT
jgi:hypothetical protein